MNSFNNIGTLSNHNSTKREDMFDERSLNSLYQLVDLHIGHLRGVRSELTQQAKYGVRPALALDFQEIFAYMYPYTQRSEDSLLVQFFIENSPHPFILPDGTQYELVLHLTKLAKRLDVVPSIVREIETASSEVEGFASVERVIHDARIDRAIARPGSGEDIPFRRVIDTIVNYDRATRKLIGLLTERPVLIIGELFPGEERSIIDLEAFSRSKQILDSLRYELSESNMADALNIATVVWMNKHPVHSYKFYLVTHTQALLGPSIWRRDKEAQIHGIESDLFKSHLAAFYAAVLSKYSQGSIEGQIRFINVAISKCIALQERILDIPGFLKPKASLPSYSIDDVWSMESWRQSVALSEQLNEFQRYFAEPVLQTIEGYLAEAARRNINVADIHGNNPSDTEEKKLTILRTTSQLRGLIQNALDICRQKVGVEPRELSPGTALRPVSVSYPALNVFSVNSQEVEKQETGTKQFRLYSHSGALVLGIDRYKGGYYSVFWNTLITIKEFSTWIYRLFNSEVKRAKVHKREPAKQDVDIDAEGMILGTDRGRYELPLQWPLDNDTLLSLLPVDTIPSYLRVNTRIGDFYLEMFVGATHRPTLIGFMSHLNLTVPIVRLFSETSSNYFWPRLIEVELEERLREYPSPLA